MINLQKTAFRIFLLLSLSTCIASAQEIDLSKNWKFKKGDDLKWADPKLNDSDWEKIKVNSPWEYQGHENYDGYAWYRLKVRIPSSIKAKTLNADSVKLYLGIIDDQDQVYLNGKLIAENAGMGFKFGATGEKNPPSAYNKTRVYTIPNPSKNILWDKENVIAIRVYDYHGNGGLLDGEAYVIKVKSAIDYIAIEKSQHPIVLNNDNTFTKKIVLSSDEIKNTQFKGKLSIKIYNITNKVIAGDSMTVTFSKSAPYEYSFTKKMQENLTIKYTFTNDNLGDSKSVSEEVPYQLTPKEKASPQINGANVFGVRPGSPFLYTIPTSGVRPMKFSVANLPSGLVLNENTGLITGKLSTMGEYKVKLKAENKSGVSEKDFTIKCGNLINLTPQMGWNSWNCWGLAVSDEKVRASAKAMVDQGLINYGWSYMNIDDGWEDKRNAEGVLLTNAKFPDMKKLADDIHTMGLKLGIYSSPGPETCGGHVGSYQFEQKDIDTWASWGIDYLKYDWCSYSDIAKLKNLENFSPTIDNEQDLDELKKPYQVMQKAIENMNPKRDMIYSLCQYGWGDVWKWGATVNGNSWRTTGDIEDSWKSMSYIGFNQATMSAYVQPGRFNDPDMLVVGKVGWGPSLRNSRLTPNEQYTHITLWSMLASPLLIGCDMAQLDEFTLNLLKNAEVIAINQDALAKQAVRIEEHTDYQIWLKELEDGSKAVGIFNISSEHKTIKLDFNKLKIASEKTLRDVWRQKDIGKFSKEYEVLVPKHGVQLLRIY
jgi:alpha-galactosidase